MGAYKRFCTQCKEYNCLRHPHPAIDSITQRLQDLLGHFEEPDENMRTYIEPEKTKGNINSPPSSSPRLTSIGQTFSESSLKNMSQTESRPMPRATAQPPVTSSAIVHVGASNASNNNAVSSKSGDTITKLTGHHYKSHERHHFVKVHASSFVSCSSPTGAYSELAFVLWVDSKPYAKYASSTDRYRIVLSLLYDSEDELWCVSAKLLKRASYYATKDEEEGHISNRLCMVSELRSEIKKMLLYLGISPREAYRLFRRNMDEDLIISDPGSGFITAETSSHISLMKELEKSPVSATGWDHGYGHGGRTQHYPHQLHHIRNRDDDKKSAIYGGMYDTDYE